MRIVCDVDKVTENAKFVKEKAGTLLTNLNSYNNGFTNKLSGWSGDGKNACDNVNSQVVSTVKAYEEKIDDYADYLTYVAEGIQKIEDELKSSNFS